jgi:DNA replication protein DnaC
MRHDPASGAIVIMLRSLKMHGMAQAVAELTGQASPAFEAAIPILSQLLKAEMAEREVRSVAYQLKAARFPVYRDLAGFDFASSEINEALVRQLHRCEFMDDANNVVLVGGPGTGKTHVATALGVQAIEHHRKRVRFFSTVELVNALEQEKTQGKAGQIANRDANALRKRLKTEGATAVIPGRSNRNKPIRYDEVRYRGRWRIEAAFCRLKDFRRIATRYDKLARNFLSAVALATLIAFWV